MPIPISRASDDTGFRFFPYPPNFTDGATNDGGVDLVRNPEQIEKISELSSIPSARTIFTDLNGPDSNFMTLGFTAGMIDDFFGGYIELAFRDSVIANNEASYSDLLQSFCDWTSMKYPDVAEAISGAFSAELQHFHLHRVPHGDRMTLWFRARNQEACDQLLTILTSFLLRN